MNISKFVLWCSFLSLIVCISAGLSLAGSAPPLPPNGYQIQPPPPGTPENIRSLCRKWSGELRNVVIRRESTFEFQNVVIAVEKIDGTSATVCFSSGDVQGQRAIAKEIAGRYPATVAEKDGVVSISFNVPQKKWIFNCTLNGDILKCRMSHETMHTVKRWGDLTPSK